MNSKWSSYAVALGNLTFCKVGCANDLFLRVVFYLCPRCCLHGSLLAHPLHLLHPLRLSYVLHTTKMLRFSTCMYVAGILELLLVCFSCLHVHLPHLVNLLIVIRFSYPNFYSSMLFSHQPLFILLKRVKHCCMLIVFYTAMFSSICNSMRLPMHLLPVCG